MEFDPQRDSSYMVREQGGVPRSGGGAAPIHIEDRIDIDRAKIMNKD